MSFVATPAPRLGIMTPTQQSCGVPILDIIVFGKLETFVALIAAIIRALFAKHHAVLMRLLRKS